MLYVLKNRLIKYLDKLLERLGYIRFRRQSSYFNKMPTFSDADIVKSSVATALSQHLTHEGPIKHEWLSDLTNDIISRIKWGQSLSIYDQLKNIPAFMSERNLTAILVAGWGAFWEIRIRNLAHILGVENFKDEGDSIEFRDLSYVLDDLKKETNGIVPEVNRIVNIRNAVVHGNYLELIDYLPNSKPKKMKERMIGSVVAISMDSSDSPVKMSDLLAARDRAKKKGPYGWFLEAATSEVFDLAIIELRKAVEIVDAIIMAKAQSYDEYEGLMQRLVSGDGIFDSEYIEKFATSRLGFFGSKEAVDKFFIELNSLISHKIKNKYGKA